MNYMNLFKNIMTWVLGPIGMILGSLDLLCWYLYGSPWSAIPMYIFTFNVLAIVFSVGMMTGGLIIASIMLIKPIRVRLFKRYQKQDDDAKFCPTCGAEKIKKPSEPECAIRIKGEELKP